MINNDLLQPAPWKHIPGPNPLLHTGDKGQWDDRYIETAGILEDHGKWYLYYHAIGGETCDGYQLGVAVSDHPLGPFTKHEANPILEVGPPGSEDDWHVAHALILKQGVDEYLMWYTVKNRAEHFEQWNVCLATANHPLGPWTKHDGNPIIRDFGYISGIAHVDGTYYCYSAYPIGSTGGEDYSPIALATAPTPQGPWTKYNDGAPVVVKGDWGEWDDGGYSDAAVVYSAGVFHMFLAGAKLASPRRLTRESIGYAWSRDGVVFHRDARNPIAPYHAAGSRCRTFTSTTRCGTSTPGSIVTARTSCKRRTSAFRCCPRRRASASTCPFCTARNWMVASRRCRSKHHQSMRRVSVRWR